MSPSRPETDAVAVYRLPMVAGAEAAVRRGVCGMSASDERGMRRVERFEGVAAGSFVWTRFADGRYFLGRISGPMREDDSAEATATELTFVRDCRWTPAPVPEVDVPGATLATFARGGRNFQQTHDAQVSRQSVAVWRARGA